MSVTQNNIENNTPNTNATDLDLLNELPFNGHGDSVASSAPESIEETNSKEFAELPFNGVGDDDGDDNGESVAPSTPAPAPAPALAPATEEAEEPSSPSLLDALPFFGIDDDEDLD